MMKYIYCVDEDMKATLLSKGFKLINTIKNPNKNVYVFKFVHELFSSDFSIDTIRQTCVLSDKLKMTLGRGVNNMENKKLKYEIESCIETIDVEDSVFAPAKIMIGYCGDNRNWSNIREEVFAEAPIKNIPVVANFYSDKNDFGGHDVKVIQNKDGIDIYAATVPFGLVPESAKQWFTEEFVDGEMKKCYWTECLLWKRQYGFNKIAESKRVNHSMEIDVSEYTERPDGYCVVDKMKFEALCLLGEDVEPCFENSRLELFSVDNFEKQFTEMLEQYKAYSLKTFK